MHRWHRRHGRKARRRHNCRINIHDVPLCQSCIFCILPLPPQPPPALSDNVPQRRHQECRPALSPGLCSSFTRNAAHSGAFAVQSIIPVCLIFVDKGCSKRDKKQLLSLISRKGHNLACARACTCVDGGGGWESVSFRRRTSFTVVSKMSQK